MTKTWDDITWGDDVSEKEWVVEYIAKVGSLAYHHLTILSGADMEEAQRALMGELRATYSEASEIEVTVLRMEVLEFDPDEPMFTGEFIP